MPRNIEPRPAVGKPVLLGGEAKPPSLKLQLLQEFRCCGSQHEAAFSEVAIGL